MLVNEFVGSLQGQLPLLAVLGQINVDKFAKQTALTTVFRYQLGAFLISLLKAEAIALVIACQTFIAPSGNLIHGNDTRLVERLAGILLHLFVILSV